MFEDHIMVVDDVLSKDECQQLIDYYKWADGESLCWTRRQMEDGTDYAKSDTSVFPLLKQVMEVAPQNPWLAPVMQKFWTHYKNYLEQYHALRDGGKEYVRSMRIQKTLPGEGYHVWHFESCGADKAQRITAWMIYLNDVDEGGETEFLYQHKRIEPKAGRLVVWPTAYTHIHRGNPPLKGEKYILTSWCEWY